jgi:radical SAM superfamily enzyme YgiQ (UPF0313 family)/glycosyltransferase involved in cell wall biosynthesis
MTKTPKIIICLPAFKAEKTLEKTINDIPKSVKSEIILVDDKSPDKTVKIARELGLKVIRHKKNRGYGGNQKTCYDAALQAGADIVVLLHPDYQYDPQTIPQLIEPILKGRADFTFGSRFAQDKNPLKGGMPYYRYLGNKFTTTIENLVLKTQFSELHSGLKAYSRRFLETIPYHSYSDNFVFDSQMLIDAVLRGFCIEEVAIPTRYREDSSSVDIYNSFKYIFQTFGELFKRKYLPSKVRAGFIGLAYKKKVLLLNPPGEKLYIRDYYCSKVSKANYLYEPPDLLILSGILYPKYQIAVIDAIAEKYPPDKCLEEIIKFAPDAIVFLSGQVSFPEDFAFLKKVKKKTGAKLIGSGDIFLEDGEKIIAQNPFIDAILLDFTTFDILDYLNGENKVSNMIYQRGSKIIIGKVERRKGGEYSIPLPRHELFPHHLYRYSLLEGKPFAVVLTDYGCPFACRFCIMGEIGFKQRSVDNVIEELKYIKSLGMRHIYFDDQTFGAHKARAEKLLKEMIKLKFDFRWVCFSRVDVCDESLLQLMKKAGCHTIMFGVESASAEILKKYDKGFSLEQIVKTFDLCRKLDIKTLGTFMLGFPGESEESILQTIAFAKKINPDYASFNIPIPRSGTQIRKEMLKSNPQWRKQDPVDQSGSFIAKGTDKISQTRLMALRKKAIIEFYLRPSYLFGRLRKIRTFYEFMQNISDAIIIFHST